MKYTKLFPILLICPFLLAAAPSNSSSNEPAEELYLDATSELIEENIDENKRIYYITLTNNQDYVAVTDYGIIHDSDGNGIANFPRVIESNILPFETIAILPGETVRYKVETNSNENYSNLRSKYGATFYKEKATEVIIENPKITIDEKNNYIFDAEFSNLYQQKYNYFSIITVEYEGITSSFCLDVHYSVFNTYNDQEIDVSKIKIKNIEIYKERSHMSGLVDAFAFLVLFTVASFAIVGILIFNFIAMIIAGIVIACVIANKKKNNN